MTGLIVYGLCVITSAMCAWLLLRGYARSRVPLLMWSGLCFVGLTLNNLLLFVVIYFGLGLLCRALGFSIEDSITTKFCGTKKSLVHGSVMLKIIFGNSAGAALLLLPIMIYHILQLLVIAVFAERYRRRNDETEQVG